MYRQVETATGIVHVELDAPQGRVILVQCPVHGRMAESMEQQAYVCTAKGCEKRLTRVEAEKVRKDGFDEIAAADRRQGREEAATSEARRQERFEQRREGKE
jgi:hypothetical protein